MNRMRTLLGWLIRGQENTTATLTSISTDLQQLQAKVARIETSVHALAERQTQLDARQLDEFDSVRTAVGRVTDDLTERIASLNERLR